MESRLQLRSAMSRGARFSAMARIQRREPPMMLEDTDINMNVVQMENLKITIPNNKDFEAEYSRDVLQREPSKENLKITFPNEVLDVDYTRQFEKNQTRGQVRRGRGGRGRGSLNLTVPSKSANERLRKPPNAPLVSGGNDINDNIEDPIKESPLSAKKSALIRSELSSPGCICLRPLMRVICRVCGYFIEGRVRQTCPEHPRDLYLYDFNTCPSRACKSDIVYLKEFPFPEGYQTEKVNLKLEQ